MHPTISTFLLSLFHPFFQYAYQNAPQCGVDILYKYVDRYVHIFVIVVSNMPDGATEFFEIVAGVLHNSSIPWRNASSSGWQGGGTEGRPGSCYFTRIAS